MPGAGQILVIRGGAIGDFILTLPVLAALRSQFPHARIEVLGYKHIAVLAQCGAFVDDIHSIEAGPLAAFFARHGDLPEPMCEFFSAFSVIISYLYDPDEIFLTNLKRCTKAQVFVGPHRPDESGQRHAAACLLEPLERLAIFDADPVPRLTLMDRAVSDARVLALHPGSGSEHKNWALDRWQALVERLINETDYQFLLVGGEADQGRLDVLGLPPDRCDTALNLPLPDLAQRLASCSSFVGHDSGITHLAAAIGLPVHVLWGPSNLDVWRPLGEHITILEAPEGLHGIPVELVFDTLKNQ